ncbi:MAG: CHAT domain-containing protein [Ferruginibacter sp.]
MPANEIKEMVKIFNTKNIASDESFAVMLGKLYPANQGIGILFYFFNQGTLRRVFFEPGKVIEKKTFSITKADLLQLSIDMNHVLDLYVQSDKKIPEKRGLKINRPAATKGITYDAVIQKACTLLLPDSFDVKYKHLLIIPALNIGTFPFYLLTPNKKEKQLIDICSVTVVPGIFDLFGLRIKVIKKAAGEGGMFDGREPIEATFIFERPLFISNPLYPVGTEFFYPDLPGAKKEIDTAIKYSGTYKLLEGDKAVKDSVIKYMKTADVVYFATHGIADEEKPMEKSFLVLSGKDPFLTAKDIMDLRTDSNYLKNNFPEMVILSACQTGLGRSMEAGVAGLARSFLLGGSDHVIMSLWNVDDDATAYLMNRFVFHLKQPHFFMPSEPLRLAMLDTREKFSLPSKWASFTLFGIDY